MSVQVYIPTPFRRATKNAARVAVDAPDVKGLLDELEDQFGGLKGLVRNEQGEVHHHVNIYVNNEAIEALQGLETTLRDGDEVSIIPALAGGGPALAGGGPALAGGGPALAGAGPALAGAGPALAGGGPAPAGGGGGGSTVRRVRAVAAGARAGDGGVSLGVLRRPPGAERARAGPAPDAVSQHPGRAARQGPGPPLARFPHRLLHRSQGSAGHRPARRAGLPRGDHLPLPQRHR